MDTASPPVSVPAASFCVQDTDIDALLSEFGGDARAAIRALLHDLAILAEDRDNSVSYGYVRGRLYANDLVSKNHAKS